MEAGALRPLVPRRLRLWRKLERQAPAAERLTVTTRGGQRLALWRVRPAGTARAAVLLLHGLGANRFAFHWPGRSVAEYLAEQGFDAYVGELRGAGASAPNHRSWTLHDYLEDDVPALLDRVREASGHDRVHFVGHSMGGILVMAHGILTQGAGLLSGTAVGSALDYGVGGSGFAPVLKVRPVLERLTSLPFGALMRAVAPFIARLPDPVAGFNFHPGATEPAIVRAVYSNVFGPLPTALLGSLASGFEPGGIKPLTGPAFLERARDFGAPLLMLAASHDRQCPLPAVDATAAKAHAKVLRFGKKFGHQTDYGHFDLLLGRHAPDEVWPALSQWLASPTIEPEVERQPRHAPGPGQ